MGLLSLPGEPEADLRRILLLGLGHLHEGGVHLIHLVVLTVYTVLEVLLHGPAAEEGARLGGSVSLVLDILIMVAGVDELCVSYSPEQAGNVGVALLLGSLSVYQVPRMGLALTSEGADEVLFSHRSNHDTTV